MPTRNVSLTEELDSYVEQSVQSGYYDSASEVVRAAIRALKQSELEDKAKVEALRTAIAKRRLRSCGNIRLHSRYLGRTAGRKLRG